MKQRSSTSVLALICDPANPDTSNNQSFHTQETLSQRLPFAEFTIVLLTELKLEILSEMPVSSRQAPLQSQLKQKEALYSQYCARADIHTTTSSAGSCFVLL